MRDFIGSKQALYLSLPLIRVEPMTQPEAEQSDQAREGQRHDEVRELGEPHAARLHEPTVADNSERGYLRGIERTPRFEKTNAWGAKIT